MADLNYPLFVYYQCFYMHPPPHSLNLTKAYIVAVLLHSYLDLFVCLFVFEVMTPVAHIYGIMYDAKVFIKSEIFLPSLHQA